ncbi:hypothetical protein Tco_1417123, partial [Tanacetum coccineum]
IIAINLDTSSDNISSDSDNNTSDSSSTSEEIDYDSPDYRGLPKSLLKWYGYLSDEYKDKGEAKVQACGSKAKLQTSSSDSSDDRKGLSKASVPIFEGPSVQGLLDYYGYNDIKEYLSWNYFPSTGKENTNKDITYKDITDEDCIHEFDYAMPKGKYVPVSNKHNLKVKSSVPVKGCVLGLANVWDEIMNKMGVRKSEIYEDKAKGKRKFVMLALFRNQAFAGKHLQLAFAGKHLQLAFTDKHLQLEFAGKHLQLAFAGKHFLLAACKQAFAELAFASCICSLHLQASICRQAFSACICSLHLQLAFAGKHLQLVFAACLCRQAFAACSLQASICRAFICILYLQLLFASKHLHLAFASKHLQVSFCKQSFSG